MSELGVGYISIVAQTGGMQKAINDALRDATKSIPDDPGRTIGDRIASGMGKTLMVGAAATGAAVAGTLGAAIGKGFSRLSNIDQAEAKLRGLGNSAEDVAAIMESANSAVTGTAFGLDEAATTAASAVAAGIKPGADLQRTLTLMGDAATIAGTDMSTMGSIVNKVATSDMMQMDVANQLMDAGIPIMQMVAEEMGVTADEAGKMASEGKVSFETFQNALESGLGGAAQESGNTFRGALANMEAAMGRFGATLVGPIFENAPAVFGAIGDAFGLLQEKVGPLAEAFGEWLGPKVADFADNLGPRLESTIENVSTALENTFTWIQDNAGWLSTLAAAVGGAAAAWGVWTAAIKLWSGVTTIATGVQKAFNDVMGMNPFLRIAMVIAAAVGALVWFFRETETGQALWERITEWLTGTMMPAISEVWETLKLGWDRFTGALQWAWESIIQPVFSAIWQLAKVTLGVIGTVVLAPLMIAWNLLSDAIQWAWGNIIQPVWSAISTFATETLWPILQSAFQWIQDKWSSLMTAIKWWWENVTKPVLDALINFATNTLWPALQSAFQWIQDKWKTMSDAFGVVWGWLRDNVFSPLSNYVTGTLWPALSSAFEWIGDKWNWLYDKFQSVWTWINDRVLTPFKDGIRAVKDFVSNMVTEIGNVWDGLKRLMAAPINVVIRYVVNGGVLAAWNVLADILPGLGEVGDVPEISGFATGGAIRGPGTETSDSILARLSTGEHVLDARDVRRLGGHDNVYRMRNFLDNGLPFTYDGRNLTGLPRTNNDVGDLYGAAPGLFPAFKDGGEVRPLWELQLERAHEFARSQSGKHYQWAGPRFVNDSFDCSGFMGSIAASIQGTNVWQRYWATGAFPPGAQGFVPGLGPGFSIGVWNGGPYGGRTAGTLGPAGPYGSVNVESGGSPSRVKYGPGAVGADHSQFVTRWHLPIGADGAFVSGGAGASPEAMQDAITAKINGAIESILGPVADRLPSGPPAWEDIPRGVYDRGREELSSFVGEAIAGLGDKLASVWTAVTEMGDLVKDAASGAWGWARRAVGLYDRGGVWKSGTLGLNLSGADEYVFTNKQMRAFSHATESLAVVSKELSEAYAGGDWGWGEMARYLGDDLAQEVFNLSAAIGRADRGFRDWAKSTEDRGRLGRPEEWAFHFGQQAAQKYGTEALGLFGLEALGDITFRKSLVDLVNTARPYANRALDDAGVPGFRFGPMRADMFQPTELIDADGRVIGTKGGGAPVYDVTAPARQVREVVIQVVGDAMSNEKVNDVMGQVSDQLGDVRVRVEKVEDELSGSVTTGLYGLV